MKKDFEQKVVLVTGAGSGIGRAAALAFAAEGAKVMAADVNAKNAEATVSLIQRGGGEASCVTADVSREKQVKEMVEKTIETYGRLDAAFNNAGVRGRRVRITELTENVWDEILNVNLKGVWLCMKYEIPHLLKSGGAIVNTSSVAGLQGLPRLTAYVASKHGVIGITKTAAMEFAKSSIRINAVCPGLIDTPMIQRTLYGKISGNSPARKLIRETKKFFGYKFLTMQQPSGRIGTPEEAAQAVVWLCSSKASFVNGHALVVDGGYIL